MRIPGRAPLLLLALLAACDAASERADAPGSEKPAVPATRTLVVRLVDGDGAPVTDSGLVWWAVKGAAFGRAVGVDENGRALLEDVPAAPLVLCALPDGFVVPSEGWPRRTVPVGVEETPLVLDVGATRTIRILGWREGALGLAYLAAEGDLEPSQHGVEKDGTLELEGLRPGVRYDLFVRDDEGGRSALLRALPADEPWPDIELAPGRDVTGRVVLPEGCDSAIVAILVGKAVLIDGGVTEDDGSFVIRAVPSGTWTVVAYTTMGEKYLASTAEVRAGESVTLDLTRPPRR